MKSMAPAASSNERRRRARSARAKRPARSGCSRRGLQRSCVGRRPCPSRPNATPSKRNGFPLENCRRRCPASASIAAAGGRRRQTAGGCNGQGNPTMTNTAESARPTPSGTKSVQDYIDELPVWADGTTLQSAPMTGMQWRIWSLAAAGKFFEGFVVFMTGVALPLIAREFDIGAAAEGHHQRREPGRHPGRRRRASAGCRTTSAARRMFIAEMIIFVAFLALLVFCTNFHLARHLPVRARPGARLRLSHGAHDHLGKHPQHQPRQAGARRVRASRRSARSAAPASATSSWSPIPNSGRLALDVRHRHHPRA